MDERNKIKIALETMFSSYPNSSVSPEAAKARITGYRVATDGFSAELVEQAVASFLRGAVPGFEGKWCPTPTELAKELCRLNDRVLAERQREQNVKRQMAARLEAPAEKSEAERKAHVKRLLGDMKHKQKMQATDKARAAIGADQFADIPSSDNKEAAAEHLEQSRQWAAGFHSQSIAE